MKPIGLKLQVTVACLLILGSICALGVPIEDAGTAAIPPSPAQAPAPVGPTPGNGGLSPVGNPGPSAPVPDASFQQPSPNSQGNGYITEHKSPDGSTLTITRFNGPLPQSAFPTNPYGYYPSPSVVQSWYDSQLQSMALYQNSWNYYLSHANNPYASLAYSNPLFSNQPNNPLWYTGFQNQFAPSSVGQWGGFAPPPQFFYPWPQPQQQLPPNRANYPSTTQTRQP